MITASPKPCRTNFFAMSRYWSDVATGLTPYVPGEQPKVLDLIKLNTNENPYPPSPRVLQAIQDELGEAGSSLRRYPDPNSEGVKAAVARFHRIETNQIFIGNGSDEVLAHVFLGLLKHSLPVLLMITACLTAASFSRTPTHRPDASSNLPISSDYCKRTPSRSW